MAILTMTNGIDRDYWTRGLRSEVSAKGPGHYVALVAATIYLLSFSQLSDTLVQPQSRIYHKYYLNSKAKVQ